MLDLTRDLDPETRSLVLTRSANLSRRVTVALTGAGADTVARLSEIAGLIGDGGGSGRLTFGGGVVLEADDVFADLATQTERLQDPLNRLRGMLGELRDAVEADRRAREVQTQIAALQAQGQSVASSIGGQSSAGRSLVAQIEALERRTGVQLQRSGGRDAELSVGDQGYITYRADHLSGSAAGLAAFRAEFYGANGLQAQIGQHNASSVAAIEQADRLRAQIRSLGAIPAFARGGVHQGGARIVGERGWEIEHTGPARIHSHAESVAMLDNRPLARGIEDLTRHVVAQGQALQLIVDRIANQMDDWDEIGLPGERS
jgi:hypothetical protein